MNEEWKKDQQTIFRFLYSSSSSNRVMRGGVAEREEEVVGRARERGTIINFFITDNRIKIHRKNFNGAREQEREREKGGRNEESERGVVKERGREKEKEGKRKIV